VEVLHLGRVAGDEGIYAGILGRIKFGTALYVRRLEPRGKVFQHAVLVLGPDTALVGLLRVFPAFAFDPEGTQAARELVSPVNAPSPFDTVVMLFVGVQRIGMLGNTKHVAI